MVSSETMQSRKISPNFLPRIVGRFNQEMFVRCTEEGSSLQWQREIIITGISFYKKFLISNEMEMMEKILGKLGKQNLLKSPNIFVS